VSLARWFERPAPWVDWWVQSALEAGRSVGGGVHAIFANLIPYETAYAASVLSRELGVPWVADLEDPWALDEMRVAPTWLNYRIDLRRMRCGLQTAAGVIMSCEEAAVRVRRSLPGLDAQVVTAIMHGYTREDYEGEAPTRDDDAFRIVHTGSLHTALGHEHVRSMPIRRALRGTSLDLDILTRSHLYLMEAIDRVIAAEPTLGRRIELHLVGGLTAADREAIGRREYVVAHGQQPHITTVGFARSADLLFVPMHDLPPGKRAGLVPCKSYEYLATGRPILAALPDGDARDLLTLFERATVVRPTDVAGMASAIEARLRDPERGVGIQGEGFEPIDQLERRCLTGEIAGVLDTVLGVEPPAPVADGALR
jgi:glycosyltransferase involved in cell wall biosynthesis